MDTTSKKSSSSGYCLFYYMNASSDPQIIVYVPYHAVFPDKTTYRGSNWKKYFLQLFVIIKTMTLSPMNFIAVSFTIDYRLDNQLQCVMFVNYVMLCYCQRLLTRKGELFIVYILRSVTYIQFFWGAMSLKQSLSHVTIIHPVIWTGPDVTVGPSLFLGLLTK